MLTFSRFHWCQFASILNRQDSLRATWVVGWERWTRKMEMGPITKGKYFLNFKIGGLTSWSDLHDLFLTYVYKSLSFIGCLWSNYIRQVFLTKQRLSSAYFTGSNTKHWTATLLVLKPFTITDIVLFLCSSTVGDFLNIGLGAYKILLHLIQRIIYSHWLYGDS